MSLENKVDLTSKNPNTEFEDLYLAVRQLEQRIYSDEQLKQLPEIAPSHVHFHEWKIRKRSSERLISYLARKNKPLRILEIGCGNGWLASQLSKIKDSNVIGQDINQLEIAQAKRVYDRINLHFTSAPFKAEKFSDLKFDIILFAASLQYFSPVEQTLKDAESCLSADGEIHIIDTNFYTSMTVSSALERKKVYYQNLGYPELAAFYFHHQIDDLQGFTYEILYNPNNLINKFRKTSPFYWFCINKSKP